MRRTNRVRVLGAVAIALCLVVSVAATSTARWAVHDGGTVTDPRDLPGGGLDDVCADQIHGLAGWAQAIGPGDDPDDFAIPAFAQTATTYEVYSAPPGSNLFVDDSQPEFRVGYLDGGGTFQEAEVAATFTSPARQAADPVTLGTDFYVFTFAPFSAPLTGVAPGDVVGIKPHPNSPLATIADLVAVGCGDRGFLRWWEKDVDFCPTAGTRVLSADVTGDRRADLVCSNQASGDLWVAAARPGGSFTSTVRRSTTTACRTATSRLLLADANGDGRADLVCQSRSTGRIQVGPGRKDGGFASATGRGRLGVCRTGTTQLVAGDVNRDGRADLVCHARKNGVIAVALATKAGRYPKVTWRSGPTRFCRAGQLLVGDLSGDRRADLLCRSGSGANAVALARKGGGFARARVGNRLAACASATHVSLGDVNRDRRADLVCHDRAAGVARIALARPGGRLPKVDFVRKVGLCTAPSERLVVGDVSGDRRADLACSARGTGIVSVSYADL